MPTEDRIALRNPDPATAGATIVRARYDQVRAAITVATPTPVSEERR